MKFLSGIIETNPWVLALAVPILGVWFMFKVRTISLHLSMRRMKRLYVLASTGKWRSAHPLAWQIAVSDALRCTMDDRIVEMAFARHNAIRMLIDSKYARGVVKISADRKGFVDDRKLPWPSLRWTARILHLISISPWLVAAVVMYIPAATAGFLFALAIVGLIYTPVFTWLAMCVEAARRLVEELDEQYPLISEDVASAAKTGRKPASKSDDVSSIKAA